MKCEMPNCTSHDYLRCRFCGLHLCSAHVNWYGGYDVNNALCPPCFDAGEVYRGAIAELQASHDRAAKLLRECWRAAVAGRATRKEPVKQQGQVTK